MDDISDRSDVEGRDIGLMLKDKERQKAARVGDIGRFSRAQQNVASVLSMNREVMNRSGHQHGRGEAILGIWLDSA